MREAILGLVGMRRNPCERWSTKVLEEGNSARKSGEDQKKDRKKGLDRNAMLR